MLIKLHGSSNWFHVNDTEANQGVGIGIGQVRYSPFNLFFSGIHDKTSYFMPHGSPAMLYGVLNKPATYLWSYHMQLTWAFYEFTKRVDVMVVSGFGWKDEVVAEFLLRFAYHEDKRLILLDGSDDSPALERFLSENPRLQGAAPYTNVIDTHPVFLSDIGEDELIGLIFNGDKQ